MKHISKTALFILTVFSISHLPLGAGDSSSGSYEDPSSSPYESFSDLPGDISVEVSPYENYNYYDYDSPGYSDYYYGPGYGYGEYDYGYNHDWHRYHDGHHEFRGNQFGHEGHGDMHHQGRGEHGGGGHGGSHGGGGHGGGGHGGHR